MNPLPPNADELVSAYLDGQAAPDEIVTVESNPDLMARVEAMRQVTTQLGAPVDPVSEQKEAHLAAALSAFDDIVASGATDAPVAEAAPVAAATPTPASEATAPSSPGVVSLEAARERRRPRRFNPGVIAAAAAALLLIAGFTALSLGRGGTTQSSEVADSSSDAVEAEFDTAVQASSDDAGAMDDEEEAMADDTSSEAFGGLADADDAASSANAEPAATPAPEPATAAAPEVEVEVEEAARDEGEEEAADDEDAMGDAVAADEEAMADEETLVESDALDLEITPFFFGEFDELAALETELTDLSRSQLEQRKGSIGEGIFARCQSLIDELAAIEEPTLIGDASVAGEPREIHAITDDAGVTTFYVVDPSDCSTIQTFP